ncbi:hypothetical protein ASD58_24215 [Duganella sp. Root1480D1]|nr:hypothetical protein ASD58_24215 [Duganella sp. Root1480D1]
MALATKCPHCNTIFRVAADQLKLRGGIVRCGSCALVFDGNAALVEPAAKPTPVIPDVVAGTPTAKPAVSDYVQGSPVDFEIDFSEEPAAAAPPPVASPAEAAPEDAAPSPAVWRTASAPAAEPASAAAQPQVKPPSPDDIAIAAVSRAFAAVTAHPAQAAAPQQVVSSRAAEPSPAPATAPVAAQPTARAPASPATRSLIDVVSPDAAFTAAAEPSPPLVPDAAAMPPNTKAGSPAAPSSLADLVAPDAIFSATAEPSPPLAPPPGSKAPSPARPAPLLDVLSPDATFSAATETTPAAAPAAAPVEQAATPADAVQPVAATEENALPWASAPAIETPSPVGPEDEHVDFEVQPLGEEKSAEPAQTAEESPLPPQDALAFEAPSPTGHVDAPADFEVLPPGDETPAELVQAAEEQALPSEAIALEAPSLAGHVDANVDFEVPPPGEEKSPEPEQAAAELALAPEARALEEPLPAGQVDVPVDFEILPLEEDQAVEPMQAAEEPTLPPEDVLAVDTPSPVEHLASTVDEAHTPEQTSEQAGASLVDAIDQWSADNTPPDGRLEPSLDTPQEHLVVAALDDAHHFEDLPSGEQPAPDAPAAAADANGLSEPSLDAEPWPAPNAETASTLSPANEPWSLSEPDETALHAVAAVNTDAPDDGASVTDDEQAAEPPAKSRRERALKRAKSRRDTSAPAAEHEVFAIEENGPAQDTSEEDAAARMRAIAGVDEAAAEDLDHSDLSFVKRVDRSQKYGKALTITMAVGVPILLAGLVVQAATTFRDTLAANYPQLKPALAAVCQPLGCKIALPTQLDALSVEPGELASMTENTFSFSTVLRNQSKTPQAWPHIELTLNDNADKPVLRRVFAPREYLPSPTETDKGFGPRSEQSIKLYFELKELKASGYHIAIFYP